MTKYVENLLLSISDRVVNKKRNTTVKDSGRKGAIENFTK